jgi:DNA-binding CsgD family transcriptional regulator
MRQADTRRLLELVVDCATAKDGGAFTSVLLPGIRELIPAQLATQHDLNRESGTLTVRGSPEGALGPDFSERIAEHATDSPLFAHQTETLDGRPLMESDFLSQRAWRRRGLYQEVNRPLGIEEELAFVIIEPRAMHAVCLSDGWGSFGDRERQLMEVMRGSLARVHATVREREAERAALRQLGGAVDATRHAIVLLGPTGRIEFSSPAADDAFERFGVDVTILSGTQDVIASKDGLRLAARRLPANDGVVPVLLEERPAPHPDLTPRELEVLELVAEGLHNSEVAERLWISTRTVERHLRNVYEKLDVSTRTAAVARAFSGRGDRPPD